MRCSADVSTPTRPSGWASSKRARQVYEELARANPEERTSASTWPTPTWRSPGLHRDAGRPDLARQSFLRAIEGAERIVRETPHVSMFKGLLAQSLSGLAELLEPRRETMPGP